MVIKAEKIISISEANQNFSKVARLAEGGEPVVIFKNNRPKYILLDIEAHDISALTADLLVEEVAKQVLADYAVVFEGIKE